MKKLILIDSHGFFFKAHYALQRAPLTNSHGEVTSVIYSFLNFLGEIFIRRDDEQVVCVLDSKGKTFRHDLYPEYKANRSPAPDELIFQIGIIEECLELMGIPAVKKDMYEADDIIAHYAYMAEQNGFLTNIFSADKDLLQLVSPNVHVVKSARIQDTWEIMKEADVESKYHIPIKALTDYFSLVGDSSDNVPGVRGIGPVMAAKLMSKYHNLETLYASLDEIAGSTRTKLSTGHEQAFLSRELIDLRKRVIDGLPKLDELVDAPLKQQELTARLRHYECFALLKKFGLVGKAASANETLRQAIAVAKRTPKGVPNTPPSAVQPSLSTADGKSMNAMPPASINSFNFNEHYQRRDVKSPAELTACLQHIEKHREMIFDLETTSLSPFDATILSLAVVCEQKSYFIFCKPASPPSPLPTLLENIDFHIDFKAFKKVLENPNIKKIGHNLKYEYQILSAHGIALQGISHDTLICEYLLDADSKRLKLEEVFRHYTGCEKSDYKDLTTHQKRSSIFDVPFQELRTYAMEDSEATAWIYMKQQALLKAHPISSIYQTLELPLISVLADIELNGVLIDTPFFHKLEKNLSHQLIQAQNHIQTLADETFNIQSTKQLQRILFEKLAIPKMRKIKTGYSTDSRVLEELKNHHDIIPAILEYRKLAKLLNTYVTTLPSLIHPKTKRIHTNYHQAIAGTGRLSSQKPNLQNIPIGAESFGIRSGFISPPDQLMVSLDYSQVELRVLAWLAQEDVLLKAYQDKLDVHAHTASILFSKPHHEISSEERGFGKTLNFSILYGVSAFSLSHQLKISNSEAKLFMEKYFASYPKITIYRDAILNAARKNLFVETYYGRRRYVRGIVSKDHLIKNRSERMAFNAVIQGTAADIIKLAMVKIHQARRENIIHADMVMQVHDELVFYIPHQYHEHDVPLLTDYLKNIKPFHQILDVSAFSGSSWGHG